jgi:hypothetical protein
VAWPATRSLGPPTIGGYRDASDDEIQASGVIYFTQGETLRMAGHPHGPVDFEESSVSGRKGHEIPLALSCFLGGLAPAIGVFVVQEVGWTVPCAVLIGLGVFAVACLVGRGSSACSHIDGTGLVPEYRSGHRDT